MKVRRPPGAPISARSPSAPVASLPITDHGFVITAAGFPCSFARQGSERVGQTTRPALSNHARGQRASARSAPSQSCRQTVALRIRAGRAAAIGGLVGAAQPIVCCGGVSIGRRSRSRFAPLGGYFTEIDGFLDSLPDCRAYRAKVLHELIWPLFSPVVSHC